MDRHRQFDPARHCFAFEQDFIGGWRCIPLCVRRKLDLIGLKLKLNHWLALTPVQRQELVDWADDAAALALLRDHLRRCTAEMADGLAADCSAAVEEPWQQRDAVPPSIATAALQSDVSLTPERWAAMNELERFAFCKLVRPGHDHHNLEAAFNEVLG